MLRRRADESASREIRSFDDLVPLLFSHTVYKSYPQNLVDQGQWVRSAQWLKTLSVEDPTHVDVSHVTNVDDWIDPMRDAGHLLLATSGSSGKCSFLNSDARRPRAEEAALAANARLAPSHAGQGPHGVPALSEPGAQQRDRGGAIGAESGVGRARSTSSPTSR